MRTPERHDTPRREIRKVIQQRPNDDAAKAVTDEMHRAGIDSTHKCRKPSGIAMQVEMHGGIGKGIDRETRLVQSARQRP